MSNNICARCGRKLTNPHSVAQELGPICFTKSGGDIFISELEADEAEWERRADELKRGVEVDMGSWDFIRDDTGHTMIIIRIAFCADAAPSDENGNIILGHDGMYTVQAINDDGSPVEHYGDFLDIRAAYACAVAAGPTEHAKALRWSRQQSREQAKAYRQQMRCRRR